MGLISRQCKAVTRKTAPEILVARFVDGRMAKNRSFAIKLCQDTAMDDPEPRVAQLIDGKQSMTKREYAT
nr:hypothetical protein CFP56_10952 [Quercus suber]POF00900.1 hypothetical protein CFP56_20848 [Quercus suber]